MERPFEPSVADLVRKLRTPRRLNGPFAITEPEAWDTPDADDPGAFVMPEDEARDLAYYALYGEDSDGDDEFELSD